MINAEMALVNTFLEIRRAISLQKFGFHDIHEPTDWLQAHGLYLCTLPSSEVME